MRRRARHPIVLCALLAVLGVGCGERGPELHARNQRLGVVPKDPRPGTLAIDSDGRGWAVKAGPEGQRRLVRNGVDGPIFPDVSEPLLAPGTKHMLFWRLPDDPAATGLMLDDEGAITQTPAARPGKLVFSKDGLHWAVAGGTGIGEPFMVDGEGKPISPKRGPVAVLHDGREVGRHSDTSFPALDASGTHIAYLSRDDDGKVRLVVDGKPSPPYDSAPEASPPKIDEHTVGPVMNAWYTVRYLPDGSILSVADHPDGWAVRQDGRVLGSYGWAAEPFPAGVQPKAPKERDAYAAFIPASIVVAEHGPIAVWWDRLAGDLPQWRVVRNGEPVDSILCPRPWEVEKPLISEDGQHVAYVCAEPEPVQPGDVVPREKMWVVHDGKRLGPYLQVWGVALSPDGKHVVYSVADGGKPKPHWRYHRDGLPFGPEYLETWPARFGPDGRRLAYEARGLDGIARLYFDDRPITHFDEVAWGPTFLSPDAVAWVVGRERALFRVEVWEGDTPPA